MPFPQIPDDAGSTQQAMVAKLSIRLSQKAMEASAEARRLIRAHRIEEARQALAAADAYQDAARMALTIAENL